MPALLDTLDRFNLTSSSIRSVTRSQSPSITPGPFTTAILNLSPQDLLRDADESEYGLFTFVRGSSDTPLEGLAAQGKVRRREFRGATPLRTRGNAGTNREEEPEVYVEAALKYLDRFHAIKPMPHARTQLESLIERLNNVRDNIDRLQTSLEEEARGGHSSPKSQAAEEERRVSELNSRILQLRKRKEALGSKRPVRSKTRPPSVTADAHIIPTKIVPPRKSSDSSSVLSTPNSYAKAKSKSRPSRDNGESSFWSGRELPNIGMHDHARSDSLLDEKLDMSAFNGLMSPTPSTIHSSHPPRPLDKPEERQRVDLIHIADLTADRLEDAEADEDDEDGESDSGEPTVVLSKLPLSQVSSAPTHATVPPSPPLSRPSSQSARPELQTPVQDDKTMDTLSSTKTKTKRVRITAEVERICSKIWSTIPDLLAPGNNFSLPGKTPPNARDTIAVLQTISAQQIPGPSSDSISSPSARSTLSSLLGIETLGPAAGSPHQIMTAHVLFSLLNAPNHSMPLTALKALLASKTAMQSPGPGAGREAKQIAAALEASATQAGTRALYGCVAKKLVKIDRGGGEQVVKFD